MQAHRKRLVLDALALAWLPNRLPDYFPSIPRPIFLSRDRKFTVASDRLIGICPSVGIASHYLDGDGCNMTEKPSRAAALLMRHYPRLYGYVYVLLGNHADTEDALQEVAMVVARKFGELEHEDSFLPWARGIARIEVMSAKRRRGRLPVLADPAAIRAISDAAQAVDRETVWSERHAALLKCVESLPPESRQIIRLRYGDDCPDVETLARKVNRTVSATYGLLKRIRHLLRGCVERKLAEGR